MKARLLTTIALGGLVALGIEACSLRLFSGSNVSHWLSSRPDNPLLLLVDGCALATLFETAFLVKLQHRNAGLETERGQLRLRYAEQLEALQLPVARLKEQNARLQESLEKMVMEREQDEIARQKERVEDAEKVQFALEQRDAVIHQLQEQMASHAKQMEAVNLALQYHRAELTQLRQGVRALQQIEPGEMHKSPRLTPAEYRAINEPLTVTPRMPETEIATDKLSPFQFLTTSDSLRETPPVEKRLSSLSSIEPQRIAAEELVG